MDNNLLCVMLLIIWVIFLKVCLYLEFFLVIVFKVICIFWLCINVLLRFWIICLIFLFVFLLIWVLGWSMICLVLSVCVCLILDCKKLIFSLKVFGFIELLILMIYGVWMMMLVILCVFMCFKLVLIFNFLIGFLCVFCGVLV